MIIGRKFNVIELFLLYNFSIFVVLCSTMISLLINLGGLVY
jgi:hypothetical protein